MRRNVDVTKDAEKVPTAREVAAKWDACLRAWQEAEARIARRRIRAWMSRDDDA